MTQDDFIEKMNEYGIPSRYYSLGSYRNGECHYLIYEHGKYGVYYVERNHPDKLAEFSSVEDAYDFMCQDILEGFGKIQVGKAKLGIAGATIVKDAAGRAFVKVGERWVRTATSAEAATEFGTVTNLSEWKNATAGEIPAPLEKGNPARGTEKTPTALPGDNVQAGTFQYSERYTLSTTWRDEQGRLTWLDPLTNQKEVIPAGVPVQIDHILPKNKIKDIPGFNELPQNIKNEIFNDPDNLQPMAGTTNQSKGCKVESCGAGFDHIKGEPVSLDYKKYLQKNRIIFVEK